MDGQIKTMCDEVLKSRSGLLAGNDEKQA